MKKWFLFLTTLTLHMGYAQPWTKSYEYVDDWSCGMAKSRQQKWERP